jgi:transketolase
MPSWELFAQQDAAYREQVLPAGVTARVAVEAARPFGWERWVGQSGTMIGVDRFGASAPFQEIYQHLGLTPEAIADAAQKQIG